MDELYLVREYNEAIFELDNLYLSYDIAERGVDLVHNKDNPDIEYLSIALHNILTVDEVVATEGAIKTVLRGIYDVLYKFLRMITQAIAKFFGLFFNRAKSVANESAIIEVKCKSASDDLKPRYSTVKLPRGIMLALSENGNMTDKIVDFSNNIYNGVKQAHTSYKLIYTLANNYLKALNVVAINKEDSVEIVKAAVAFNNGIVNGYGCKPINKKFYGKITSMQSVKEVGIGKSINVIDTSRIGILGVKNKETLISVITNVKIVTAPWVSSYNVVPVKPLTMTDMLKSIDIINKANSLILDYKSRDMNKDLNRLKDELEKVSRAILDSLNTDNVGKAKVDLASKLLAGGRRVNVTTSKVLSIELNGYISRINAINKYMNISLSNLSK